jgi:putative YhdH/YhfP family quinone oxidoreductase
LSKQTDRILRGRQPMSAIEWNLTSAATGDGRTSEPSFEGLADMAATYEAFVVHREDDGTINRQVESKDVEQLPEGDLLIRVHYSSLNYKDALSANGHRGVTRQYPHTPGIDASGVVVQSSSPDFKVDQRVVIGGYGFGVNVPGGFGQYVRVPAEWVLPLPDGLSLADSMAYGGAGFTACYSICRLEHLGLRPEKGPVLVTGATGGVGSMSVAMLSQLGYEVAAVTRKRDQQPWLEKLGASTVLEPANVIPPASRALARTRWAGVIDSVGGDLLDGAIRACQPDAPVTCCGMIASPSLETSIFPFILRGVSLLGIDAANCPQDRRMEVWQRLAGECQVPELTDMITDISIHELNDRIETMLDGSGVGRVRVCLNGDQPAK